MTGQRLRQGSINWETILSLQSFAQKIIKKIELLAFTNKVKIVKTFIPEKVKIYIENNLFREIDYFEKKYSIKINFIPDSRLIIPEYKIELLNKSKKIIDTVEKIDKINFIKSNTLSKKKDEKIKSENKIELKKSKKLKSSRKKTIKLRTLWVRKKKKSN